MVKKNLFYVFLNVYKNIFIKRVRPSAGLFILLTLQGTYIQ